MCADVDVFILLSCLDGSMSYNRNIRDNASRRSSYGYKKNQEFHKKSFRKNFVNGFTDDYNDDELNELGNENDDDGSLNGINKLPKKYSVSVQNDLQTLKNLLRPFQNGDKKNWPKHLRNLTLFFEKSDSFSQTLVEFTDRYVIFLFDKSSDIVVLFRTFGDITSLLYKIYLAKLFPDIVEELIQCASSLSTRLISLNREFVVFLFSIYFNKGAINEEETQCVILKTLQNVVDKSSSGVNENYFFIQKKLKVAIENAKNIKILMQASQLMISIGERSPNSLQPYMKDLVDILIGWFLDSHQPEIFIFLIENLMSSIDFCFRNDYHFSLMLLTQFIEDFEKYYEEVLIKFNNELDNNLKSNKMPNSQFHKMALLVRIFSIVFQNLDFPANSLTIEGNRFLEILKLFFKVVISLKHHKKVAFFEELISECNNSICIIVKTLSYQPYPIYDFKSFEPQFNNYSEILFEMFPNSSQKFLTTSLVLLQVFVEKLDLSLSLEFVPKLFSSKFQQTKFYLNDDVQRAYFCLINTVLRIKSVEIFVQSYQQILKHLKHAMHGLYYLKNDPNSKCKILSHIEIETDIMATLYTTEQNCLISVNSDLILLAEIANSKHSLMSMWALSPKFMDLMIFHINPANIWLAETYPSLHYSFIYLLSSYCQKHNNFIAQSSLFNNVTNTAIPSLISIVDNKESSIEKEQSTSKSSNQMRFSSVKVTNKYLLDILNLIKSVLKISKLDIETIILCLQWVDNIVELFKANNKLCIGINLHEFATLMDIISEYSFSNNYHVCKISCKIFQELLPIINDELPIYSSVISNYKKACEFNIAHTDKQISKLFQDLFAILPSYSRSINIVSSKIINRVYSIQNETFFYPDEAHLSIICLMEKNPSEHFSSLAFQSIIEFIFKAENSFDLNWLSRLFYSVFDNNQMKISMTLKSTISYLPFISNNLNSLKIFQNNYWTLVFWACWELVQHCIENRLKTPLGKPQETFTKIESAIKIFIADISNLRVMHTENSVNITIIRIRMLINIMENFDKLIYNAIFGHSFRLYTPSKTSKSFFKKNKATCYEWINRNRRSIMLLASKVGDQTSVIRHGEELLRAYIVDNSIFTVNEIEFILLLMVDALIHLQAPESIMGYYIWAKQCLNVKFSWIKAATDEANSRYENALKLYQSELASKQSNSDSGSTGASSLNLISSNANFNCHNYTISFFQKRTLNCYFNLQNYDEAISWAQSSEFNTTCNLFNSNIDYSYLKSLSTFSDISDLPFENQNYNFKGVLWDVESIFHSLQSHLFKTTYTLYNSKESGWNHLINQELDDLLKNKLNPLTKSYYLCGLSAENTPISNLQKIAHRLKLIVDNQNHTKKPESLFYIDSNVNISLLTNTLLWHKIFLKLNNKSKQVDKTIMLESLDDLLLKTVIKSRKYLNFQFAQDLLLQYAESAVGIDISNNKSFGNSILLNIFEDSLRKPYSNNNIKFCMETSKLFHAIGEADLSIDVLLKSINVFIEKSSTNPEMSELNSRMFLKLVSYWQTDSVKCENSNYIKLSQFRKFNMIDEKITCIKSLNHNENFVGKLLLYAVNTCPSLAKAWYRLADWSYKLGRKLSDVEEDKINNEQSPSEKGDNILEFYKLSANSYIRFLHISTHAGCDDVNATLRLLRLILKHAPELREILEGGLKNTPTKPWKNITLQLFSRLNHHEQYVRQSISDLLCRIGVDSPHLVIFPAVAGSLDDQVKTDKFDYTATQNAEDDDDEEESSQSTDSCIMQNCYTSLLDTLGQHNPNLIAQTKLMVHELRRITVLWDELWIGTLQHNLNEVKKQVLLLEKEIEKTKLNSNLHDNEKALFIKEQHNIFFRRILYSLKLTKLITSDAPETSHEEWFQQNFNQLIDNLIDSISNPENIYEPSNILYHYQNLLQTIRKLSVLTNNYRCQMQDISPQLATIENSVIPLPGLNASSTLSTVTLKRVFKTVSILHTYTKPKKIVFIGSDGRNYTYLFKGHEDLHLDERIMQFLSIVNKMIVKFDTNRIINRKLFCRTRHYSVTPLGSKSGLIQWVEGGQALYNLYKKWLVNREVSLEDINKKVTAVDLFKGKLVEKGIASENRSDWNVKTLVEIYNELHNETPNNLIHKELWCSSVNSYDFWCLTQNFITSNAIMSMIGYILGLGDRHLDNIMLDLTTGEVIHIDYNICFEKGKSLRVPEMVLCRLTQNITNAFGITGTEGAFRISCENILRILRKGKETLLTLLEAFVYDPLIDWTPEHEEGYTGAIYGGARVAQLAKEGKIIPKKQMEKENLEAIKKLNQFMRTIELRNTDWPKINKEEDMINCDDFLAVKNDIPPSEDSKTNLPGSNKSKKSKQNAYAFSVWKKIKMKVIHFSVCEWDIQFINLSNFSLMVEIWI